MAIRNSTVLEVLILLGALLQGCQNFYLVGTDNGVALSSSSVSSYSSATDTVLVPWDSIPLPMYYDFNEVLFNGYLSLHTQRTLRMHFVLDSAQAPESVDFYGEILMAEIPSVQLNGSSVWEQFELDTLDGNFVVDFSNSFSAKYEGVFEIVNQRNSSYSVRLWAALGYESADSAELDFVSGIRILETSQISKQERALNANGFEWELFSTVARDSVLGVFGGESLVNVTLIPRSELDGYLETGTFQVTPPYQRMQQGDTLRYYSANAEDWALVYSNSDTVETSLQDSVVVYQLLF